MTIPRAGGPIVGRSNWQMALSERLALEGLLCDLKPELSIELGTAQGGTLERIAAHSAHVHTFDLEVQVERSHFPNVTFHEGDNHVLLPQLLRTLEREGSEVGFVLVDGDHRSDGVRRDVEDLLASPALRTTYILLHDTMNEGVLAGLRRVDFEAHPGVLYVDLAFLRLLQRPATPVSETWGGFGLIVVDRDGRTGLAPTRRIDTRSPAAAASTALWHAAAPARIARRGLAERVTAVVRRGGS
jgi:methyltransferase family protein